MDGCLDDQVIKICCRPRSREVRMQGSGDGGDGDWGAVILPYPTTPPPHPPPRGSGLIDGGGSRADEGTLASPGCALK